MAQLHSNGLTIEYDTFGDRSADPLLLIMGLSMQMTAWSPDFCNALAAHGHYVIRFDNRDIGLSTKLDGVKAPGRWRYLMHRLFRTDLRAPYSLQDMATDTAGVLDALDIEAAHVVGASMGGMIAQLLTVEHPGRVKSLTSLMSTSSAPGLPGAKPELVRHMFTGRPRTSDPEVMIEHTVATAKMLGSPGYRRSDEEWRELISASVRRSFYPQGFIRQMAAIVADGSRVERLKTIETPTLVIHGREDPLVRVEGGIDTAKHIRNARLEIIEGMGHDIPPPLVEKITGLIADHAASNA